MAGCKICGAPHVTCGPPSTVVPVDQRIQEREGPTVALKRYTVPVQVGRNITETVMKLTPAEAERLGGKEITTKARTPQNKQRTPANKSTKTE